MNKFQYYTGGIKATIPKGYVSLTSFLSKIRNPNPATLVLLGSISDASREGDKKTKTLLKNKLPFFTPSVIVEDGKPRRYENIASFTGLAPIDFDGFDNIDQANDCKHWLFEQNTEVICAYLSPSRLGVKALVLIPVCNEVEEFQDYYRGLTKKYRDDFHIKQFDTAPQNAILPLFYAYDKDVLIRDNAVTFVDKVLKPVYVPSEVVMNVESDKPRIDILVNKFFERCHNIVDNGHPQFRSACIMLGSLVPHYVNEIDALAYTESAIRSNGYMISKHPFETYYKTAKWAIDVGMKSPYTL